jgi:hypothetical protein
LEAVGFYEAAEAVPDWSLDCYPGSGLAHGLAAAPSDFRTFQDCPKDLPADLSHADPAADRLHARVGQVLVVAQWPEGADGGHEEARGHQGPWRRGDGVAGGSRQE